MQRRAARKAVWIVGATIALIERGQGNEWKRAAVRDN